MRFIFGSAIAAVLLIIIIIIIVTGGGSKVSSPKQVDLMKLANSSGTVEFITQGELVANEDRREIKITVGANYSTLEIIKGYSGEVISSHSIPNTKPAYSAFLRGLELAEFNKGNKRADPDERGHCPLGRTYIYKVIDQNGHTKQRYWSDDCSSSDGSFQGNQRVVQELFKKQIPKYFDWTYSVRLG